MQPAHTGSRPEDGALTRRLLPFQSAPRSWPGMFIGMLALLCLIQPSLAPAQGLGRPDIFNTDNLPSGDGTTSDVDAARARLIRINGQVLAASDSPLHQPAPAELNLDESRVQLNLFDDTTLTAAIEKTLYRNSTNFVATGVLDGWPGSKITLVANGDIIAATVDVPSLGTFQIRYAGNGLHKVVELDKSKIPGCNKIKKAPKNPRPIKIKPSRKRPPVVGSEPGKFTPPAMAFNPASVFTEDVLGLTPPVEASGAGNTNVDVMVVYTAAARIGAGGTDAMNALIDLAMSEANDTFENSEIPVNLNLVFRGEVTYTETANAGTDLSRLQNPNDGYMDAVHVWRNAYGADMVCLFTETMNSYAGIGYLMTNPSTNFGSYSFSVVRRVFATGAYTFPHELGHNFGCAHDRQNASGGAYPYSFGHRFVGNDSQTYRTVMAYSPGTRIPYFSNPNVTYQGVATGVAIGATNAANNAASISNTAPYVAAFRAPVVIVSFNSSSNSVSETNGTLTINITRSSLTNDAVTVDYATINGTALDSSDFTATNGTLSFAGGETTKTITVPVTDDGLRESTETFTVRLSNLSAGSLFTSNATVYITDDDTSYVAFGSTNITVSESTNVVSVDVVRTGTTNTAVTVGYTTLNVTAVAGSDYVTTNGLLNFAAGETSKTVSVTVLNDVLAENSETFLVRLRTPTNTVFTTATNFIVTITTNDSSVLAFTSATNLVSEGDGTLTLTVVRTGTTNNAVSINFATTNVTASSASDYSATNGTLSFAAGETNKTFTIDLTDDDTIESIETLRVVLSNPSDARLTIGTNTVTITDNDTSAVGFTVATNLVSETNGTLTLTVVRTGATNTAVSVDFATTNITALAGSDYTATNGTLSFAAGETTNTFNIEIVDNGTQEVAETFRVRLFNPSNTALGTSTNVVTIADDDGSTVGFSVASLTVSEDTNSVTITVVRTGTTNTAVSVNYATLSNGTATVSSDFRGTNGLLSFAAGVATNTFAVAILNDSPAENGETINLRLSNPTNTALGTSNLVLTINTNDSAILAFSVATNLVSEGDGTLTLTVNRTGTTNNAVSVDFTTTNITASSASDYSATNGTVSFAAGEISKTFTVDLTDDDTQETNETFRVILSNAADARITVGTNLVTVTDDDVSVVGFTVATNLVSETNGTLTLTVLRTGATNTAISVDFATTNITATAGSDYTATNGTLNFAAGETTNEITITIADDQSLELNETFRVRLSNVSNTSIGIATNTVTIDDDDVATVSFTASAFNVTENTNDIAITVLRTGATNSVVSVRYATLAAGTAAAGADFTATNGLFVFGLGETSKTFNVKVLDDTLAENNETILLRLSNVTNAVYGTTNLTITITTNDSSILSFAAATNAVTEGDGTLTFTVTRTGTTNNAVSVDFVTTNATASSASDYSHTNGTLSFAAGETNKSFTVDLTDDDTQEAVETFRIVLSSPVDARLLIGTNTVTVTDDDISTTRFAASGIGTSETNGIVEFDVVRIGATNTTVTVDFYTTNVTALAGSDYTATNGTITFLPGEELKTFTVVLLDDATQESMETFEGRLVNLSNSTLGTSNLPVAVYDDDASTVGFSASAISVAENTNLVTVTVTRTGTTNTAVSVNFATLTNGTATVVSDYRATNGILSFAPGVTSATFALAVINDLIAENNETINLRLSNPTNCSLGTSNLTVTITTNDSALLSFSVASSTNSEADGTVTLTVVRTGTTNNAVTVDFTSTNLTASSASDYSATNGTLSFAPGETNATFTVDLTDDDTVEATESFRFVLSNPIDARIVLGTNTVTITDDDASTVGFTVVTNNVSETNGTLTFTVVRAGATNTAVAVDFFTTNATALAGSDYTATNGTLNFAAGETTNTFTLDIVDDQTLENTENFQVRLSNASNTAIGVGTNFVTIADDDAATIGFTLSTLSVAENTNNVTITVLRSGATNTVASVRYATLTNGTATAGTDFRATNGLFVFGLGETSKTFTLTVLDDTIAENNETILLRLSNPTNTTLTTSNLTVTITTNDSAVLSFSTASTTNSEADGTITLTVNRTGTTNNAVTVDFTSTNVTASSASDYSATNGTLSFAAGETSKTFTVDLTDDDTQEAVETFRFVLSNPVDARLLVGTNLVTMTDDDASSVGFTVTTNSVSETNGTLTLTVVRTGATNTAVTVDFATTNGTATAGSDYTATNGTLSFAAGETTNTIDIDITDNLSQEASETFLVRLSNASNTSIGAGTNFVTITDEDGATIGFNVAAVSVTEDTNSLTITVVRTGSTNTVASVNFATLTNGNATVVSDYRATNGILSFAAGVTTNTFALAIINDSVAENNETILLRLSSPTNCSLGTSNLTVTVTTNDSAILSFTVASSTNSEADGTITLTVSRTGTTNNAVAVQFTSTNVTASSASDYSSTNGTLSFAAGETNQTFTVDLTDDDTQEATESFRLVLSNPTDGRITIGTNTVTITDDDLSTVSFTTNAVTVSETNGTLTLLVLRSGATNTAVSVDFTTANLSATAGTDYAATNGTLNFAAGETTNTIDIDITDNLTQETNETFAVRLSNASNTSLGIGTNTVTITDEDVATIGFAVASVTVSEDTNTLTIAVVRTGSTNTAASVNFATLTNGTATVVSDYRATNGILSFAAGVTTNTFALAIINDSLAENSETIMLRLSNPTNTSLGTSNLTVTITTNDSAILSFSVAGSTNSEANGTITLTVNRTGTTNNVVTVDFTSTNVTASSASDYSATNGTLSFAAGETSKTFTVDLTDDDTQETNETFRLVLSNPADSRIAVGTNTVTITDDDASTVGFTVATNNISETNGTLTLTVVRTGATNTAVTVNFATTNLTALAGSDYTATNGTLNFAAGETTNTFDVEITDNLTQETNETFQVRLISASNTSIGLGTNVVNISDDDVAAVAFAVASLSVAEDTNLVTIAVIRSGSTNTAVSVNFATLTNGTATAGSDFRATNGVLSFAPGVTTNTFALAILNDTTAENNETVLLRLSSPTNITLGTSNLTVTITTNDSAILSFASAGSTNSEADGTLTLTVNRTGTTNNAVTVEFTSTNVTASWASDYSPTNGTLSFAAGETSKTFTVDLTDDDTQEATETFRFVLSNPTDSRIAVGTNTVTVTDDDGSTVALTTNAVTVSETNGTLTLTVIRSGATNTAVAVDFATVNVSAVAGNDYTATNGTLNFAAGETTNTIDIEITDNLSQETNETFQVRLSNASNTTLGVGTNTVTITDEDAASVAFSVASISVAEDTNTVTIAVVRTGATNTTVSVNFATLTNGTATVVSDYRATNGVLTFAPGVATNTFALAIVNDSNAENNETILLRLSNPTNTSLGTSNLTVTITTNDSAIVSFSAAGSTNSEADGTITLTVSRTGTTNNVVTVDFTTTNVTASSASDYSPTNGTLSFAAGETNKTFTVDLTDDDTQESTETFRIVLSNPTDSRLSIVTNTVTITDDDVSTIGFTATTASVSETNGTVTLTVVRTGATNTTVTVDYATTNVSAQAGADYTADSGTLTFNPGETTNTVDITLSDNATQESAETFQVRLSNVSNSTLTNGTNVVTITDDDASSIGFTVSTISVAENTNTVTLTVVRTGSTNTAASVIFTNLATSTATAGTDFVATNGVLTFAAGVTTNTFAIAVINDSTPENNEHIAYRLVSANNCSLGTSNIVITITTNDSAVLAWSIGATNLAEDGGTLTLTVNRTGTTNNAVSVDFTTTNVSATAEVDYSPTNGTISFAPGEISQTITVDVTEDDLQEVNETFRVVLSSPSDATITLGTNTVTITDNDGSTLSFATNAVSLDETNVSVTLTVIRDGATNTAVSVDYHTTNGVTTTATDGSDYTGDANTLAFAPGETEQTITITLTDDLDYEVNEKFRVILSGITNSTLLVGTNTVTITDDDYAAVGFTASTATANELDGTMFVTVERTGVTNTEVSVAYNTVNLTATAGVDYTATSGVLTFAPGETEQTIAVDVTFDDDIESPETFRIRLVSFTNAAPDSVTNLTVTLNDAFGDIPAANMVSITSVQAVSPTELRLQVAGPNGAGVVIEATTNLTHWVPVATNVISGNGFQWTTPIDPAMPARFFRVSPPAQ